METKKTKALFFTKEDIHVSFCKELESYDFVFFIKSVFCNEVNDLKSHFIPIVFVDFSFLCACGFTVLLKIKNRFPSSLLYVLSEEDSSCFAVQSLKFGADDYLVFPLDFEKLSIQINRALNLKFPVTSGQLFPEFIGKSPRIIELKRLIHKYAKSDLPILILGESGTGKSLLAKLIHKYSEYSQNSFFEENMATIPENLAEATLFGTKKGAYTGAENRIGLIEAAHGGTLFLDEITETSLGIQAKLLRFISEKAYRSLGETREKKAKVRLITASNIDIVEAVKDKLFREDLYYRISPLTIELPTLNERKDDIPLLIQYFVDKKDKEITFGAIELLKKHHWRGNVRELQSTLDRAFCLCTNNTVTTGDIIFY